jgi:hypothetical protein
MKDLRNGLNKRTTESRNTRKARKMNRDKELFRDFRDKKS